MGCDMSQSDSSFRIKQENFDKCLEAIKALDPNKEDTIGDSFAYVNTKEYKEAKTLGLALAAWRWQVQYEEKDGDIIDIYFDCEKLGNDIILFHAIAPFVEKDSFIQMNGEEGDMWRWCFDGKICYQVRPTITWDS
jgi:hypothetical protein